tara:strand:- start:218 stop:484 length:267 start_codon:yes stop_codon:yes gene_type:complete
MSRLIPKLTSNLSLKLKLSPKQALELAQTVRELIPSETLAPGTMPTQLGVETTIPDHGPQLLLAAPVEGETTVRVRLPQLEMVGAPMI